MIDILCCIACFIIGVVIGAFCMACFCIGDDDYDE